MFDRTLLGIEDLYLRHSTPEYSRAFNVAAAILEASGGPALVVASSAVYAVEFLKRCHHPLDFAISASFDAESFVARAQDWAWGPIRAVTLDSGHERYAACAWAEPEDSTSIEIAQLLSDHSLPAAVLAVVASSYLRRYLPDWQATPLPACAPIGPGVAMSHLRAAGWSIESALVYHGPRSIVWSRLQHLADALGRPDWADRCRLAMWESYQEERWMWPLSPLALIRARIV